jgi:hypothetical protein
MKSPPITDRGRRVCRSGVGEWQIVCAVSGVRDLYQCWYRSGSQEWLHQAGILGPVKINPRDGKRGLLASPSGPLDQSDNPTKLSLQTGVTRCGAFGPPLCSVRLGVKGSQVQILSSRPERTGPSPEYQPR